MVHDLRALLRLASSRTPDPSAVMAMKTREETCIMGHSSEGSVGDGSSDTKKRYRATPG